MNEVTRLAQSARQAAPAMARLGRKQKDDILLAMAQALRDHCPEILAANERDLSQADANGIAPAMQDRLRLNPMRVEDMAQGMTQIASLNDPTARVLEGWRRPNGLLIEKRCVPIGVIGMIYESRPNVTADTVSLCIKSGNACVLRGGKEAILSNIAIMNVLREAGENAGMPVGAIALIEDTDRQSARDLMTANGLIDVLIPRGGAGLIRSVIEQASVPVIETGTGNCHLFVDESADYTMALDLLINGKCSRPAVCNALETLLVHQHVAATFLPLAIDALRANGVEVRGCERTVAIDNTVAAATLEDYETEYDDLIIAVKVVDSLADALAHIETYSTKHSECIVTDSEQNAQRFLDEVDAAAVYVNASTRFTDGGEFGFGAEIGISTQKLHVRGPMGLEALTSIKYVVRGQGQVRV